MSFLLKINAQDGDLNMKIVAHVNAPEGGSGIWHHYDKKRKIEYAVLGSRTSTILFSLEDPKNPKERFRLTGGTTTWREVFSYGDYVYAVTDVETEDGLAIIDMSKGPDSIKGSFWKPSVDVKGNAAVLGKCHTVFIDEKGILSLNGCTPWRGTVFFDLKPNPKVPVYIGAITQRYCHDNYARRDTIYSSEINDGKLTIYDASDYKNIKEIASFNTPNNFNHNSWLSDDSKYIFTTDERADAFLASFDISDLKNIKLLDKYKPKDTENTGVVPHNTRYLNGYLITSYYSDGVKIVDAHKPDNLVEVGSFDTYKFSETGFVGTWGVSPFLPSGLIVASNMNDGLYVIEPTYIRACYLEGLVTDTITEIPINNVSVKISVARKNEDFSDVSGIYKTGYATAGEYEVTYTHPDYFPKTVKASLLNGKVTIKDVQLISRRPTVTAKVIIKDSVTGQLLSSAHVRIMSPIDDKTTNTIADGSASLFIFQDSIPYQIVAGKWGYRHKAVTYASDKNPGIVEIRLARGYQDDFIFDQGWLVNSTASTGAWKRAEPTGTVYRGDQFQTELDIQSDYGPDCYVTGNNGGDPSTDDIDNGNTILTSPVMRLSNYKEPLLSYYYWFVNAGGQGTPNDKMTIRISNGINIVFVKEISIHSPDWVSSGIIKLKDLITLTDSMRVVIDIADDQPGHLLDAAFDDFLLIDGIISSSESATQDIVMRAYPNAFNEKCYLSYNVKNNENLSINLSIVDQFGKEINQRKLEVNSDVIEIGENLKSGIYFAKITNGKSISSVKLVKL